MELFDKILATYHPPKNLALTLMETVFNISSAFLSLLMENVSNFSNFVRLVETNIVKMKSCAGIEPMSSYDKSDQCWFHPRISDQFYVVLQSILKKIRKLYNIIYIHINSPCLF